MMGRLGKKARGGLALLSRKLTGRTAPLEINIHITDRCNLACTYCYSNFYKRHNPDISLENVRRIVDAFCDMGVMEVSLIGGEPFLHPAFPDIVSHIRGRHLFCSAVTNGSFIATHLDTAKKLDMVCVSVDGPEEINDITRGRGSYRKAMEGLRLCADNGINRSIRATLQKHNLHCIEHLVDIAAATAQC